ncbi:MAG: metal-dependent hydrolase [Granulosicoccus sp.]
MDSVSQMVLGASLAHLCLGKHLGKRAILLGAALGTLPDLDVVIPYADAIDSFTYHRSWSHSLLVLSFASFPISWMLKQVIQNRSAGFWQWWLCVWLVLVTHPLLDALTVYGTQIWWPLDRQPSAWGSVFIIDPAYTLPLIVALIIAWRRGFARSRRIVLLSLIASTLYLGWTLVAQHMVRQTLESTLASQGIQANTTVVAPFPLSLLWRTLAISDEYYYEGYRSLFDRQSVITLEQYDNGKSTHATWLDHPPIKRLAWFTDGAFALSNRDDTLIASDLRMGIEGSYVFEFLIADTGEPVLTRLLPVNMDTQRLPLLFQRVLDESIDLRPHQMR